MFKLLVKKGFKPSNVRNLGVEICRNGTLAQLKWVLKEYGDQALNRGEAENTLRLVASYDSQKSFAKLRFLLQHTKWHQDELDMAILEYCSYGGDPEGLVLLRKTGARISARGDEDETLLHAAASNRLGLHMLKWLLDLKELDVNRRDEKGRTPIFHSATPEIFRALVASGAHQETKDYKDITLLMAMCQSQKGSCISEALAGPYGNINAVDCMGNSALFYLLESRNRQSTSVLIDAGANPKQVFEGYKVSLNIFFCFFSHLALERSRRGSGS
jgi:ankyrin repeat protein